jgi:DNA uptake protein ComE-like DNA-binding protein
MPTSSEKRALIFLAALAALGVSVRAFRGGVASSGDSGDALDRQIAAVDSATSKSRSDRSGRTRVAARSRRVPVDSVEKSGGRSDPPRRVQSATVGATDPLAKYEERRREVAESNRASQERLSELHRVITVTPKAPAARGDAPSERRPPDPVDLDTADEVTIATVPWIGPALAARIVAERTRGGTFGSLEGLQRVAGIGPGLARRIASRVRFSGSGMGPPKVIRFRKIRP